MAKDDPSVGKQAIAGAIGALVGQRLAGLPGAVAGSASVPYILALIDQVQAEWRQDQRQRIVTMTEAAGEASGRDPDALGVLMGSTEHTRLLTATAAEAAAKTAWPPKVVAIGHALAAGLLAADDATIDTEPMILAALADIEMPQAALLDLLVRHWPLQSPDGVRAEPFLWDERATGMPWAPGSRVWLAADIRAARPTLAPVLPSLLGTLARHGLAAQSDEPGDPFGRTGRAMQQRFMSDVAQRQREVGNLSPVVNVQFYAPVGSWLPTELGERVLNELLEAGADFKS
jgi:hypothetical protein